MKYLKKFNQASEYEAFKVGDEYITPNVSYIEENTGVMFESVKPLTYNMVDLGLPSGLLWADRNVGATSPEDTGLYFQWGDTVGWTAEQVANGDKWFSWSSYFDTTDGGSTFEKYHKSGLYCLESPDDAATVNMGVEYRMPTNTELKELVNNTVVSFVDISGKELGETELQSANLQFVKFTGSNGNFIIIPSSGLYSGKNYMNEDCVWLWTSIRYSYNSTNANCLLANNNGVNASKYTLRNYGMPVRGVQSK